MWFVPPKVDDTGNFSKVTVQLFASFKVSFLPVETLSLNNSTWISLTGIVCPSSNSQVFVTFKSLVGISIGVHIKDQIAYNSISLSRIPVLNVSPIEYIVPLPSACVFHPLKIYPALFIVPAFKTVTLSVSASFPSALTDG